METKDRINVGLVITLSKTKLNVQQLLKHSIMFGTRMLEKRVGMPYVTTALVVLPIMHSYRKTTVNRLSGCVEKVNL